MAAALLASMSGCANVQALEQPHAVALPMPPEVAERFAYEAGEIHAELSLVRENSTYRVFEGSFDPLIAGSDDDTPISFEYYEQIGTDMAPVVLVLPILNGQKHVVRPFATYFAENGYNAVIVDTVQRKTLLEDMLQPEEAIRRTTIRHRRVLDWIDTVPNIDKSRVAVFGASLGGFNALFVSAADERVSASALALVAGDLPFVLTHSSERRINEAADGAMATLQTDREGLRRFLEDNIDSDPLSLARHLDPERVLLMLAKFDDSVHYEKQLELRQALGNPESITVPAGHVTTAAYLFYLRSRVLEFFDRKLALPAPAPPGPVAAEPEAADDDLLARPAVEAPFTGAPVTAAEHAPLLDRTQQTVENVVTGTARVVDNMFGSADVEEEASVTRGRLSVGGQWDQRDGLRERIRLKARF
ncbi:MAG TPA: dienelactone hydrolase family protein, partial [Woeseiaceae bacterium]|nr:dienelactone hydrolase family protein [Woeseiaceae bacterium]